MNDGNRKPAHPLRMMAADYDSHIRDENPVPQRSSFQRNDRDRHQSSHQRGKGKGRQKYDATMGTIDDYITPEMLEDPWIDLYARRSKEVRWSITAHLTPPEQARMERNIVDTQEVKRIQSVDRCNS
jgi:hypothetical protein